MSRYVNTCGHYHALPAFEDPATYETQVKAWNLKSLVPHHITWSFYKGKNIKKYNEEPCKPEKMGSDICGDWFVTGDFYRLHPLFIYLFVCLLLVLYDCKTGRTSCLTFNLLYIVTC